MPLRVDLNCDLGEDTGPTGSTRDEAILAWVTSVNIACGYHAGDHNVMRRTLQLAAAKGVGLGAHPGLPDRQGFGRRSMKVEPDDVFNMVVYQVGALQALAAVSGQRLQHVKPHGVLYNRAARETPVARAIVDAVHAVDPGLILFALSGGEVVRVGRAAGLLVAEEGFADRTYQPDGTLTPRTSPGAVITDPGEAARRAVRMVKEGEIAAADGSELTLHIDTVCIHGDEPQAPTFAKMLRQTLERNGIRVQRIGGR